MSQSTSHASSAPGKVLWIASYPKSGNTWIRVLLAKLLFGEQKSTGALRRQIPDIHGDAVDELPAHLGRVFIKTHFAYSGRMPLVDQTVGFIYLARNPLDVALSSLNYAMLESFVPHDDSDAKNTYLDRFAREGGDYRWRAVGMGNWQEHVSSWLGLGRHLPHLVIRYEDLIADTAGQVGRLSRFLSVDPTTEQVANIIEQSSFKSMRNLEQREIARQGDTFFKDQRFSKGQDQGLRFMNRGMAGEGAKQLNQVQCAAIEDSCGEAMRLLGYLPKNA